MEGDGSLNNVSGYDHPQTSYNNNSDHEVDEVNMNPQEDGPLGLRLRRSASLASLVEGRLREEKEEENIFYSQPSCNKLKASNFPATLLEIGTWKWESKHVGDLVGKLYYSKKKLVWEFLFGSLKKKLEISWCQISAINAFISKGQNGRLHIQLNEPPLFCQEINCQPGKHTQWTTTTIDFTGGQARTCRLMKAECLPGVLDKHLSSLFQCDKRLLHLSRQPFPLHNSSYFHNTHLSFSNQQTTSVPVCHQHHLPAFVSTSNLPSSASEARISQDNEGVLEQSGSFQIQETCSILIGEDLPYHGPETMILNPQGIQNQHEINYEDEVGYTDDEIIVTPLRFWLPGEGVSNTTDYGVVNHIACVEDVTIYQEPSSGLPANYDQDNHMLDNLLDPRVEDYGTLRRQQ